MLLTLVLILRIGLLRPEYSRLSVPSPEFVLMHAVPLALPVAAMGAVLAGRDRGMWRAAVISAAAAAIVVTLTVALPLVRHPESVTIDESAKVVTVGDAMCPTVQRTSQHGAGSSNAGVLSGGTTPST